MLATITPSPVWRVPEALPADIFENIRRRAILDHCKWDPQVNDQGTLSPFPLILRASVWQQLADWAEQLTVETLAAEAELIRHPCLHRSLGLGWSIRRILRQAGRLGLTPAAVRVMRFDFHLTTEGWRISEVNSDVPGGFTEASSFTAQIAAHYSHTRPAGNPIAAWAEALTAGLAAGAVIGLLSAPGFMEDQQIMAYLATHLPARGCRSFLISPQQLRWREGIAHLESAAYTGPLAVVVRFYQGEWLPGLARGSGWTHFFCGGRTPVGNPGVALLSESKRFPLTWDALHAALPTWRRLLPETREPRDAPWQHDEGWLLKTAFSNTGDTVSVRSLLPDKEWRRVRRDVFLRPRDWVAQRRFTPIAVATPAGPFHPCVGVYTINGRVAGAYARATADQIINYAASDIALLVEDDPA